MKPEIWDMFMKIGLSFGAIITGLVTFFITRKKKEKKVKSSNIISPILDYSDSFWTVHSSIQESLTELRVMSDCARTQLIQFHNGGRFIDGMSMKRLSLTHESLANGVAGDQRRSQDLLMSMFLLFLSRIKEDNAAIHYVTDLEESYTKQYFEFSNTVAYSVLPIKKETVIVGYVMAHWCREEKADMANIEIVDDWMHRTQRLIEVDLTNEGHKKKNEA
jgi:hypothetical protein